LEKFDKLVEKKEYVGRSEAIRDAMRSYISQTEWEADQEGAMASLNIVYKHKPKLMANLIEAQHNTLAHVVSTVHVHVSQNHCLEVIILKGDRKSIESLANKVSGLTGIEYVRLFTFVLPEVSEKGHYHSH